jgi:hypothetical protein
MIGHQQWHLHDPTHPRFEAARAAALGIRSAGLSRSDGPGRRAGQVPKDATTFVLLSHGMAAHYDGTHLLDAVLTASTDWTRAAPMNTSSRSASAHWPSCQPPFNGAWPRWQPWLRPRAAIRRAVQRIRDGGARGRLFLAPNTTVAACA